MLRQRRHAAAPSTTPPNAIVNPNGGGPVFGRKIEVSEVSTMGGAKLERGEARGMPYGPPLPPGLDDDGQERGLVFVCFNASIARQFEVVQTQWCNHGDAFGLGDDCDFLLGGQGSGKMTIQGRPPTFVRAAWPK